VAVCADTSRPSHPQQAADRGAKTYLASMFVIPSDFERATANLAAHAARHAMTVVLANYGGPSGGLTSAGRSAICSETGDLLTQLGPIGAGIAVASESHSGWRARSILLGDRYFASAEQA
jgi:predicted amidohydrolase